MTAPNPRDVDAALLSLTERGFPEFSKILAAHIAALKKVRDEWERESERQAKRAVDAENARDVALADNAELVRTLTPVGSEARAVFEAHHAPSHCALGLNLKVHHGEALVSVIAQPHPGAGLLDELETLRGQRALFEEAAQALYGYSEFAGPCAHGRCPWDRCDECGEGTSVAAAQKVIVKMAEEHRKALARAARWKAAAKRVWQRAVDLGQVCAGLHQVLDDINAWIRTYDATWMYPAPDFLLPRLKQLVADREQAALTKADQRILATAQPPDFLREHHPERMEYEAAMSGYSVGVNYALDTIRRMIKVKKAINTRTTT